MIVYERPTSRAALWARRLSRLGFGVLVLSLAAHRFGPLETGHFIALALVSAVLALMGALLAVVGMVQLWRVAAIGGIASFMALLYAALPLGFAGIGLAHALSTPLLADVSTDLVTPPPWIVPLKPEAAWLQPAIAVPAERELQAAAYPALTGRRYEGALDRVLAGVRTVAQTSGMTITAEEGLENAGPDLEDLPARTDAEAALREDAPVPVPVQRPPEVIEHLPPGRRATDILLQGEWRSPIVGFRFDVLIRMREEAETTFVDLRVASRAGPRDLGFSAEVAERFLHALDAELLGIAGD